MSSTSEPPTNGKVVLVTTHGDIDVELWSKECPRTCRNFVQLCLDGYYDKCIWHRIVKDLLVQTGDPSGVGTGGEDIYGGVEDFAGGREIHPRLRFSHRGRVAMAGTKGSQFFVSLSPAAWLNGKHAIFGKVTGDTIFSALRLAELDVDAQDRPTLDDAPQILRVNVLVNPFPELLPRRARQEVPPPAEPPKGKAPPKKMAHRVTLSFADDEDEGDGNQVPSLGARASGQRRGIMSIHEADIVKNVAPAGVQRAAAAAREALEDLQSSGDEDAGVVPRSRDDNADDNSGKGPARIAPPNDSEVRKKPAPAANEFSALLAKIRGVPAAAPAPPSVTTEAVPVSALAAMRAAYVEKRSAVRGRAGEAATLARLAAFEGKLAVAKKATTVSSSMTGGASYHGQVLEDVDDAPERDADGVAWATGKLSFVRHIDDAHRGVFGTKRLREEEPK
jgi:cyclophilin family peptidyl-prolyl cis-trans isomerase